MDIPVTEKSNRLSSKSALQAQGIHTDLALHTLGWKAFQDLCAQICEEVFHMPVSVYREAQDGGQDAVLIYEQKGGFSKTGTVQCKFSSDRSKRLRLGDLTPEIESIKELVASDQADNYKFITSMGVDAPVAAKIRKKLTELGVKTPEVYGREWISLKIRESVRLRTLVPRVYGLGDLSTILDQRAAAQTKALLGHLQSSLRLYVPTAAHRQAVHVMSKAGIVLLLGLPATGKSMIAAILATSAIEDREHRCFKVNSPQELMKVWNPNESGGFYWIDDAFGSNQLRSDYVDEWSSKMNEIRAAISAGNRFVFTSRTHIWNAAKSKLGTRCLPAFADSSAIVHVGSLDQEERSQILYNHIKGGDQSQSWKEAVKEHLEELSNDENLLPEIARRLGDQKYTTGISINPKELARFVETPMDFLKDTIGELSPPQQAALVLVFLSGSCLHSDLEESNHGGIVCNKFDVTMASIGDALCQLNGSFVVKKVDVSHESWTFAHPTLTDAMASVLGDRADLVDLYLAGAKLSSILSDTICAGQTDILDSIVIADRSIDLLVARLSEVEDEPTLNRQLFLYLNERASEPVFREFLGKNREIFNRRNQYSRRISNDWLIRFYARCARYGLLPEEISLAVALKLENALFEEFDAGFLDDDELLRLIPPTKLIAAICKLESYMKDVLPDRIEELESRATSEEEGYLVFDDMSSFVTNIEHAFLGSNLSGYAETVNELISDSSGRVDAQYIEPDNDWDVEDVAPVKASSQSFSRSIFSDVEE